MTCEQTRVVPDGVTANIAAALLLTTAHGLLEIFLALTPPKRCGIALAACARIAAAQYAESFILAAIPRCVPQTQ